MFTIFEVFLLGICWVFLLLWNFQRPTSYKKMWKELHTEENWEVADDHRLGLVKINRWDETIWETIIRRSTNDDYEHTNNPS